MRSDRVENLYRLSPMQEGMLFHSLYDRGADPYVDQSACTLEGALDAGALRRAWADLGERHPVLRSAFHWRQLEHPLQVVFRDAETPWREKDWRHLDPGAWQARLQALLDDDRDRGFDLEAPPLMRLTLIREGERRYRFLWTYHHLILDGWSLALVLRELFAAYEARLQHQAPRLGPPPRPYADYIGWLRDRGLEGAESFWRRVLAGFSSPTSLGLAEAAPVAGQRPDPADRELQLPEETTAALANLARRARVTLATVVHGAWALLLSRYSGERDVAFGTVVSGRPPQLEGSETMVGLLINTVPVRVRVPPASRLTAWLADLQHLQLDAREHQHAPLAEVQKWSEVPPGTPLFTTILAFENYPRDSSLWDHTGGLAVRDLVTVERTNYPLSLSIVPQDRLWLRLTYDRRRFSAAAAGRLLGHLARLSTAMAESPASRLRELPMLSAGERRQLTAAWNVTAGGDEVPEGCLHQLFEARAAADPAAVAVAFEDASGERRTLSYGELERRSARLARLLAARGAGREARVGLALERSPELVVAMLAVLRAGGAWVPLDPSYPRPRLSFMVADAGVELVLASAPAQALLPAAGVRVVALEELEAAAPPAADLPAVEPGRLAYVIYTSGSTGRPKGVMVAHRGAVSLAAAQQRLFGAAPGDRVLLFASPSFDASVWET
ncbi:MAG: condensation domain-containing protein, partial [Thermoanaerobaculia bacterium]